LTRFASESSIDSAVVTRLTDDEVPAANNDAMAKKKTSIKTSRKSWAKDTENRSFSAGDRIRLFCEISRQANDFIGTRKATVAEIRSEFATLCSSMASNARVHKNQVSQYLRLHRLLEDEVEKLAKDADCSDPIESRKSGHAKKHTYKSRMTISHALLLAAVKDTKQRKKLLDDAIANHWPHTVLKEKSKIDREGSIVHPVKSGEKRVRVRNRATINALTTATAELLKLLGELEDAAFTQAITKSDRRDPADTLEKLKNLVSTFEVIRKALPLAKKAATSAAEKLKKFIDQKR